MNSGSQSTSSGTVFTTPSNGDYIPQIDSTSSSGDILSGINDVTQAHKFDPSIQVAFNMNIIRKSLLSMIIYVE